MLESFYLTGWGAFGMTLFLFLPFFIAFLYIVLKKSFVDASPSGASKSQFARAEYMWIGFVSLVFIVVNIASIEFMPTVATAKANASGKEIMEITVAAQSWSFDISEGTIEVGKPVRFSGKSLDTMHGFALYHPNGKVLFTMMLMPGTDGPTSLVHTFKEPGTYTVRCLEYCGAAHHEMKDEITVVASKG